MVSKKTRSLAAKKGWETRRAKARAKEEARKRRSEAAKKAWAKGGARRYAYEERAGIQERKPRKVKPPRGFVEAPPETILSRGKRYPRVFDAADDARERLLLLELERLQRKKQKRKPPRMTKDERTRLRLAEHADSLVNVEIAIREIAEEGEYSAKELYDLFFSPDAA